MKLAVYLNLLVWLSQLLFDCLHLYFGSFIYGGLFMALWFDCGKGYSKASFARGRLNKDVYLCCPGPSLAYVRNDFMHVPGALVIAINIAYPQIKPDIWVGLDKLDCHPNLLWHENFIKICRSGFHDYKKDNVFVREFFNTYFADIENGDFEDIFTRRAHDVQFFFNGNTFLTAIHIAVWLGAKRIHLVGCDFGGNKDYYTDKVLPTDLRDSNRKLYQQQVAAMELIVKLGNKHGVEFISCTENSPVHKFMKYEPLLQALSNTYTRYKNLLELKFEAPKEVSELPHISELLMCDWVDGNPIGDGVIVGCIKEQEDLIPWFVNKYKKFCKLPLVFADFGISEKSKEYCRRFGQVLNVSDIQADGWMRKPFVCLRTPFKRTIWLDLDIEILSDISPYFVFGTGGNIGLSEDWYQNNNPHNKMFRENIPDDLKMPDTGVIVFEHGNPLIRKWALKILACKDLYKGDHQVLGVVFRDNGVKEEYNIPKTLHRMRLDNPNPIPPLTTFHWTGEIGKNYIRSELKKLPAWDMNPKSKILFVTLLPQSINLPDNTVGDYVGARCEMSNIHSFIRNFDNVNYEISLLFGSSHQSSLDLVRNFFSTYKMSTVLLDFKFDPDKMNERRAHEIAFNKNELYKYTVNKDFDYIFFIDSDMYISPDCIYRCIQKYLTDFKTFVSFPCCLRDTGTIHEISGGAFLTTKSLWNVWAKSNDNIYTVSDKDKNGVVYPDNKLHLSGAEDCNLVRYFKALPGAKYVKPTDVETIHCIDNDICQYYSNGNTFKRVPLSHFTASPVVVDVSTPTPFPLRLYKSSIGPLGVSNAELEPYLVKENKGVVDVK